MSAYHSVLSPAVSLQRASLARSVRPDPTPPTVSVVYADWGDNLVFLYETAANERAELFRALANSRTWGEFRKAVTPERYDQVLELTKWLRDDDGSGLSFEEFYMMPESGSPVAVCIEEVEAACQTYDRMGLEERPGALVPFRVDSIWGFSEGDWPEWPAKGMLHWIPTSVRECHGEIQASGLNGNFLRLDPAKEAEIVAEMTYSGYICRRDDQLVEAAHWG